MSGSSLHECLHRFPGAVLELSDGGVVQASNGHLDALIGSDLAGRPLAEVLDDTSQRKWSRLVASETGRDDASWELVFKAGGSLELRTFVVVWGAAEEADRRLWLVEHAASRSTERKFEEIAAINAELVHTQRELAREKKRLARALSDATAAVAVRDEVLAFVSHDLRNPVNTIVMAADLLDLPIPDDRKTVQAQVIRRAAASMSRLIEDLLAVSEVAVGRLSLERQPLLLDGLFEEVCSQFENMARQKRQRLDWYVAADVPSIQGDRHRLIQVLSNLVGNATKFTPEHGLIRLQAMTNSDQVLVSVEDTGSGIPEADLPHVFTRFIHAGRASGGGAGLGLAIAKAVVEAHAGRIWVESAPGRGSTFFFSLPTSER